MRALATLVFLLAIMPAPAPAQDTAGYPSRPVRIVVCVPAGGGIDTVTRILAEGLHRKLGQPFVVENRGGAAGNIGAEFVFNAEADGYTLLAAVPAPLTINPLLYKSLKFEPAAFLPVAIMTTVPNVLLVRPDFPANDAKEFLAYARANPGKINYASQGIGTTSHLTAELFAQRAGVTFQHVPYRGTGPALNDLIASHVDFIFMELASAINLHRAGKARILAVATRQRLATLPDIPTLDEAGVRNFESATWNALAAPPRTPQAIVDRLNKAVNEVMAEPAVRAHFETLSLTAASGSPADAAAFIKQETSVWGDVIRAAHVEAR